MIEAKNIIVLLLNDKYLEISQKEVKKILDKPVKCDYKYKNLYTPSIDVYKLPNGLLVDGTFLTCFLEGESVLKVENTYKPITMYDKPQELDLYGLYSIRKET